MFLKEIYRYLKTVGPIFSHYQVIKAMQTALDRSSEKTK